MHIAADDIVPASQRSAVGVIGKDRTGDALRVRANQLKYLHFAVGDQRWVTAKDDFRPALFVGDHLPPIGPDGR